ncbi:hypothetical protein RJ639_026187 [Escallonia herrerae]|uniref:Retrotransposon Copia-like N-terminal domain-containing protein n=1 Tax=Escallonia herrerae TaxID=1293975 RepID=A0AA88RX14_9ASTE|nr:hypothetical protein RJ639_026187 [Escallonia herrerae]
MIHALTAKNKIGFINGSIEQPSEKDQPTEYALWNQCNNMILSWLTHSVEPDLAKGVIHAKTAYQVWEDFKDQFSQKNAPAIYQIQKSLASFSQGTMTVSNLFHKTQRPLGRFFLPQSGKITNTRSHVEFFVGLTEQMLGGGLRGNQVEEGVEGGRKARGKEGLLKMRPLQYGAEHVHVLVYNQAQVSCEDNNV